MWIELLVLGALDNLGRDWPAWCWQCPTARGNHWLRFEVVWPLEDLVWFYLLYSMRSHIHSWNMERGWLDEEKFGSAMSMVGWFMEVPWLVGLCIINMTLFLLFISRVLYWFICGLYGCCFLGISVTNMLVMNVYYDSSYICLSSCF